MERFDLIPYYDWTKEEQYINYKMKNIDYSWEDIVTHVNIGLNNPFYSAVKKIKCPDSILVLVNKYNQLDCNYIPNDLELIDPHFNAGELKLRHEARFAFEIMCWAAEMEGIHLEAISTFRSYSYQETVYMKNKTPDISMEEYQSIRDKVSARPGHSEHQTGLAVDINDLEQTFADTPAGKWLAENSYRFGYVLRYPKGKEKITGYDYEPWHFRYLGRGLATAVYHSKLTYDEYYVRYL